MLLVSLRTIVRNYVMFMWKVSGKTFVLSNHHATVNVRIRSLHILFSTSCTMQPTYIQSHSVIKHFSSLNKIHFYCSSQLSHVRTKAIPPNFEWDMWFDYKRFMRYIPLEFHVKWRLEEAKLMMINIIIVFTVDVYVAHTIYTDYFH